MPPRKRRKSAPKPSWRDTLFYWRGELGVSDSDALYGAFIWTGTWVGSDDGVLPAAEKFAQSENEFNLIHRCEEDEPSWEMFDDISDHGSEHGALPRDMPYIPPELNFEGFYMLDNGNGPEETEDNEHTVAYDRREIEKDGTYTENHLVTACGDTPFGRFVSHGRIVIRNGEAELTLARRYITDTDARAKLTARELAEKLADDDMAPWERLPVCA